MLGTSCERSVEKWSHEGADVASRGQRCTTYLHVHQCAVLSGPGLLQNLKDGHSAAIHDVYLTLADSEPSQTELGLQQLLLRPLGIVVGIILKMRKINWIILDLTLAHF